MTHVKTEKLTVLALVGLGAALGYLAACRQDNPQRNAEAQEGAASDQTPASGASKPGSRRVGIAGLFPGQGPRS